MKPRHVTTIVAALLIGATAGALGAPTPTPQTRTITKTETLHIPLPTQHRAAPNRWPTPPTPIGELEAQPQPEPEPARPATHRILSPHDPPWTPERVERLAQCESGGDWTINTGPFSGGLQFKQSSWELVGGVGSPHEASKEEQIARGRLLWDRQGWLAWPSCSCRAGWISRWSYEGEEHECPNFWVN